MNADEYGQEQPIQIANVEQATAWNGDDGDDWTNHEEQYNRTSERHTNRLFAMAQIRPTDHDSGRRMRLRRHHATSSTDRHGRRRARRGPLVADAGARPQTQPCRGTEEHQVRACGRPGLPVRGCGVRHRDQPVRRHVLRRPGRRLPEHWPRPSSRAVTSHFWRGSRLPTTSGFASSLPSSRPAGISHGHRPVRQGCSGWPTQTLCAGYSGRPADDEIRLDDVSEPVMAGTDADDAFSFVRSLGVTRGLLRDLDAETTAQILNSLRKLTVAHDTGQGVFLNSAAWLITARRR